MRRRNLELRKIGKLALTKTLFKERFMKSSPCRPTFLVLAKVINSSLLMIIDIFPKLILAIEPSKITLQIMNPIKLLIRHQKHHPVNDYLQVQVTIAR